MMNQEKALSVLKKDRAFSCMGRQQISKEFFVAGGRTQVCDISLPLYTDRQFLMEKLRRNMDVDNGRCVLLHGTHMATVFYILKVFSAC